MAKWSCQRLPLTVIQLGAIIFYNYVENTSFDNILCSEIWKCVEDYHSYKWSPRQAANTFLLCPHSVLSLATALIYENAVLMFNSFSTAYSCNPLVPVLNIFGMRPLVNGIDIHYIWDICQQPPPQLDALYCEKSTFVDIRTQSLTASFVDSRTGRVNLAVLYIRVAYSIMWVLFKIIKVRLRRLMCV